MCSLQRGIRNNSNITSTERLRNFASDKPWEKYVRTDEWFDKQERQWTTNIGPFWLQEKIYRHQKKRQSNQPSKKLRSSFDNAFNWKQHCFICAKPAHTCCTNKSNIIKVMILRLRDNLVVCAKERNDDWRKSVLERLGSCNDLLAEEAVDHATCMTKFRLTRCSDNGKVNLWT